MIKLVDCTLRDGGYYNTWDFPPELIENYFKAMEAISVDYVEIGFRTLNTHGYKGGCGYSTNRYIRSLNIPQDLKLAVMINAAELVKHPEGVIAALESLFPPVKESPVSLVRIACHMPEIEPVMVGIPWLKEKGYLATINFMQIADRSEDEIINCAKVVSRYPLDVLYFADSMGSLNPDQTSSIIHILRIHWKGEIGIHTHDNMCLGLANSMRAIEEGVKWVDGTVTGMGRGPGNAKTEYLAIEIEPYRSVPSNLTKLLSVINKYFKPMQDKYRWGPNPYYYLAGKYGIHPTFIQEMLGDTRYDEEDILAVISNLRNEAGKKFSITALENARNFYDAEPKGTWAPADMIAGRDVLILGSGPGVMMHKRAIELFIKTWKPFVIALNTQKGIDAKLINIRAACHPVRLLVDCREHITLPHPVAIPASQLPGHIHDALGNKQLLDFGLNVQADTFIFEKTHCTIPNSLVVAYALAIANSGRANRILLAGFDGYEADDPRNIEMDNLLAIYKKAEGSLDVLAITPTKYKISTTSVYAM